MPHPYPTVLADEIGWLTAAQMVEVDRVMIEGLHIELIQMMENAGRHLSQLVLDLATPSSATVLAGSGGNGGGGLVCARHLANQGVDVRVVLGSDRFSGVPAHQLDVVTRMGLAVVSAATEPPPADAVVDALVGYSLRGAPRGRIGELIERAPGLGPVISLDNPSGLDVSEGTIPGSAVRAEATLTLALPKVGLRGAEATGVLHLADISVPPAVYETIGVGPAPDFSRSSILRIIDSPTPAPRRGRGTPSPDG